MHLGYMSTSTFLSILHASFGIRIQMWTRLYSQMLVTMIEQLGGTPKDKDELVLFHQPRSHQQFGHDSRVVTVTNLHLQSLVRSPYKAAEAVRQQFFFGFVYIIQKSFKHNRMCSKIVEVDLVCLHDQNPQSATEDAQRLSKQMRFVKNFKYSLHYRIAIES